MKIREGMFLTVLIFGIQIVGSVLLSSVLRWREVKKMSCIECGDNISEGNAHYTDGGHEICSDCFHGVERHVITRASIDTKKPPTAPTVNGH